MNGGLVRHQSILLMDIYVKGARSCAFCYRCNVTSMTHNEEPESEGFYSNKSFCIVKDPQKFVDSKRTQIVREAQPSAHGYLVCNLISCVFLLCIH